MRALLDLLASGVDPSPGARASRRDHRGVDPPWRFGGRLLESAAGTPDLYDFAARSYSPGLGAFTSLDSKAGSAQNPITFNRYLYANANPATLVDPDGHTACRFGREDCYEMAQAHKTATSAASTDPTGDAARAAFRMGASTSPSTAPSSGCLATGDCQVSITSTTAKQAVEDDQALIDKAIADRQAQVTAKANKCDNIICGFTNTVGNGLIQAAPYAAVGLAAWGGCTLMTGGVGAPACAALVAGSIGGYYGGKGLENAVDNYQNGRSLTDDIWKYTNLKDYSVAVAVPVVGKVIEKLDPLHDPFSSNGLAAYFGDEANQSTSGAVNQCQAGLAAFLTAASTKLPGTGWPGIVFGSLTGMANSITNALAGACR